MHELIDKETEIARLTTSLGRSVGFRNRVEAKPGPNRWSEITAKDFGPEHDFELYDNGRAWIFYAESEAALQWCYRFLPADCPRWGERGFVIENEYIAGVAKGATICRLISLEEYDNRQAENEQAQHQDEQR